MCHFLNIAQDKNQIEGLGQCQCQSQCNLNITKYFDGNFQRLGKNAVI